MKSRPRKFLPVLALAAMLCTIPACESFYGFVDEQGQAIPDDVRLADAQARLDSMTATHSKLEDALATVLSERDALEANIAELNVTLALLREAGADTSGVEAALATVQRAVDASAAYGDEVAAKLEEVGGVLESLQADVDDGTLGGAAVGTVAVIDGAAKVAPAFGPYGQAVSLGLLALSGWLTNRGRQFKAQRDAKAAETALVVHSVDVLLSSGYVEDAHGAKNVLRDALGAVGNPAVRRAKIGN